MSFGFVVFALSIFRRRIEGSAPLRLAAALVVLWPSSIIHSIRVHNDALASPLMLASLYFTAEWDERGRARDFRAALAAAALSILTKSSGYAVAATLVLFALLRVHATRGQRESTKRCAVAILVLATTGVLAVGIRESREPTTLCQKVLGHACDGRYVPSVADTPSRFLSFDVRDFLRRTDTLPDDPERDYVLNRQSRACSA